MKISVRFIVIITAILWLMNASAVAQGSTLTGVWLTDVKSHVTIKKCRQGFCGYISKVAIRPSLYEKNKEAIDRVGISNAYDFFNKDETLRARRLMGLQIITFGEKNSAGIYQGEVYNPEDGNTYSGKVELLDKDKLRLTGCTFFGIICRSEFWFRVHPGR